MKWKERNIKIDAVVGQKQIITFVPLEELTNIASLTSSCGCGTPKLVNGNIEVRYTPGAIPSHLSKTGMYKTTLKITITYKDNTQEKLSFTALVTKKTRKL